MDRRRFFGEAKTPPLYIFDGEQDGSHLLGDFKAKDQKGRSYFQNRELMVSPNGWLELNVYFYLGTSTNPQPIDTSKYTKLCLLGRSEDYAGTKARFGLSQMGGVLFSGYVTVERSNTDTLYEVDISNRTSGFPAFYVPESQYAEYPPPDVHCKKIWLE